MTATFSLLASLPRPFASREATSQSDCAALSRQGPDLVSPFIEAILSSDEDQMQKKLAGLADYLSGKSSSAAWFNLGRLAASLFFRRAAEEYFEKSASLAQAQGDDEGEAQAWLSLGSLYSDDEDWDRACRFYEKALQALDEGKSLPLMCTVLINLGRASSSARGSLKSGAVLFQGFTFARWR